MTDHLGASAGWQPANPLEGDALRVLVIENEPAAGPGQVGRWLLSEGITLDICRPYAGDLVPEQVGADGLIVLGGSVGSNDDVDAPWLPATRALLQNAVETGVPTLGICLGAQLLAAALGGVVERGTSGPEAGVHPIHVNAGDDPLFGDLPTVSHAFQFHVDAVTRLPEGAVRLASNSAYENQAFRMGSCAWAVQFHPEVTAEDVRIWTRAYPYVVTKGGRDSEQVVEELAAFQNQLDETWAAVTRRWASQLRRKAAENASVSRVGE